MGMRVGAQEGKVSEFLNVTKEILALVDLRAWNPIYHPDWIWKLSAKGKRHDECLKVIEHFVDNVIEEWRNYLLQVKQDANVSIATGKKRMALLDTLLHSTMDDKPLSNKDIRGEVNTSASEKWRGFEAYQWFKIETFQ